MAPRLVSAKRGSGRRRTASKTVITPRGRTPYSWELSPGEGIVKGSRWGALTARATAGYTPEDGTFELGETGLEYLKRMSPRWRAVLSVEGEQDEWALIAEAQLTLAPAPALKLNNGFGITNKAPDMAPELGLPYSFGSGSTPR